MKRASSSSSGTVLVYALLVLAVGAVLLAGWIHVMADRAIYTDQAIAAIKRRIVLENSRALASQYLLGSVLMGSHSLAVTGTLADSWGGFTLAATSVVPLTSVAAPATINVFSPGGNAGYTADITGTLSDGSGGSYADFAWTFHARSRSPFFGFDLLVSQAPTLSPSSNITIPSGVAVYGNVLLWLPNSPNSYSLTASSYQTPTQADGSSPTVIFSNGGSALSMSNFAFMPQTSGQGYAGLTSTINSGSTGIAYTASLLYKAGWPPSRGLVGATDPAPSNVSVYTDDLNPATLPNATVNLAKIPPDPASSGVSVVASGTLSIDLSDPSLQRVYILGDLSRLILVGNTAANAVAADALPAVLIVYSESATSSPKLSSIVLQNQNNRRLYLAVKKAVGGTVTIQNTTTGSPLPWRLAATFENTPISFSIAAGSLQITGGIRSDQSVFLPARTICLLRETNPILLERDADRNVWLEAFEQ